MVMKIMVKGKKERSKKQQIVVVEDMRRELQQQTKSGDKSAGTNARNA